jgi:hypothetical protein
MAQPNPLLDIALAYIDAGLSVVPIPPDGSKYPSLPGWKTYQRRLATEAELRRWFAPGHIVGIAVIGGQVSGNLEILDFDDATAWEEWRNLCFERELWYVAGDIVISDLPRVETPSGGHHVYYRVADPVVGGSTKLASIPNPDYDPERKDEPGYHVKKFLCRIETRGEGGLAVTAPSPAECHEDKRPYVLVEGDLTNIPVISPEDRDALLSMARVFDQYGDQARPAGAPASSSQASPSNAGLKPGEDYNVRGDWRRELQSAGWRMLHDAGGKEIWQRPGKQGRGVSATWNYHSAGVFYVFSSNAHPFQEGRTYFPFGIYAALRHGGDHKAAARALGSEGYGEQRPAPVPATAAAPAASVRNDAVPGNDAPPHPAQAGPGGSPPAISPTRAILAALPGAGRRGAEHADPVEPASDWDEPPIPLNGTKTAPFPLEAIPRSIAWFADEVASVVQVPIDLTAMMGISVVSAMAARRCTVQVGVTHQETTNLYYMGLMESGERKTAAVKAMAKPLFELEKTVYEQRKATHESDKARHDVETKRLAHLKDQAAKENNPLKRSDLLNEIQALADSIEPPQPYPSMLLYDATVEKIANRMAEQEDNTLAHIHDEGGMFTMLAGRYSKHSFANLDLVMNAFNGSQYRIDRINRPPDIIHAATLTIGLSIQPRILRNLHKQPEFRELGFLARFLINIPDSMMGYREFPNRPINKDAEALFREVVFSIYNLHSLATAEDRGRRHLLHLQGEAWDLWVHYSKEIERELRPGGSLYSARDWGSKLPGAVARLAGVFHLVEHYRHPRPWEIPIASETVAHAWALGLYFIPHQLNAFGEMQADPMTKLAKRILGWIERGKLRQFTTRDCIRMHENETKEDVERALLMLADYGYARLETTTRKGEHGRKPKPAWGVHPDVSQGMLPVGQLNDGPI